ncbi:LegC family aminotransferase [Salibacterium salarium]|uniref:LegC family aminotransferase n=1 Tax=Salibacterium salarium TaxID=284579 RepID=A0A428MV79_9BACI|nr:LegC family aminotransferase [Salibacterium salarium]RSL29996.1 LegC family aminotransferase [Salibacterium salarium]
MNTTIPLSVPNLSPDILKNLEETISTGWVSTGGRFIEEFESKFAHYVGVERALSCQSGTAGLHLALRAIEVGHKDEVIVPTLTFIAAVNPVKYMGAEPVFMDCDETLNMDMEKLEMFLEKECKMIKGQVINKKTQRIIKAIVVVHVFGNPAYMEKVMELRQKYNLKVVEDATEALGSVYRTGEHANKHCGTIGDAGVYSFNANKIITTGGGGMVVSRNQEMMETMNVLSRQAKTDSIYYIHDEVGYNYRMTNIQAAFGTDQIDRLEDFINAKIRNFKLYKEVLRDTDGLTLLPFRTDVRANHWFYSILVDKKAYGLDADGLLKKLNDYHIQSRPLWGLIHKQKPYAKNQHYQIEKANDYEGSIINIPCSSHLTIEEIERVLYVLTRREKTSPYIRVLPQVGDEINEQTI